MTRTVQVFWTFRQTNDSSERRKIKDNLDILIINNMAHFSIRFGHLSYIFITVDIGNKKLLCLRTWELDMEKSSGVGDLWVF